MGIQRGRQAGDRREQVCSGQMVPSYGETLRLPNRQLADLGSKNVEKRAVFLGNCAEIALWHGSCITQERLGRAATLTR